MSVPISNPAAAWGETASNAGPTVHCIAANSISQGEVVALSTSPGYVIRNLVATSAGLQMGVALRTATSGQGVAVQIGGIATVLKGTASLTAFHIAGADPTVSGAVGDVSQATAVTQAKDVRGFIGTILADSTAGATTVLVNLGKF